MTERPNINIIIAIITIIGNGTPIAFTPNSINKIYKS